jgi:hypothetical protein
MRSQLRVPIVALMVAFPIQPLGVTPSFAQVATPPPLPPARPDQLVEFHPPNEAILEDAENRRVGEKYVFDLCRGGPPAQAEPGRLNPSDSTCGDPLNPSATVRGGNPPYHFQLDAMGGFPPMGMWVDLNGVLRGTPKNTRGARFKVCAVDLSERFDCQWVEIPPAAEQPVLRASKKSGASGGKAAVAIVGVGVAVGGAVYAGKMLGDLANTAAGSCASNRFCVVSVMSSGCSCAGSVSGGCDWTGPTVGEGGGCGAGAPCASNLSCNNGRCEGSGGRCPF